MDWSSLARFRRIHFRHIRGRDTHCTITFPVIFGWIEQKYSYVQAFANVYVNFSSVSSTLDLNTPSVLTTVCGISSRFVHVTVVPTGIVNASGPNLKLSIFTSITAAGVAAAGTAAAGIAAGMATACAVAVDAPTATVTAAGRATTGRTLSPDAALPKLIATIKIVPPTNTPLRIVVSPSSYRFAFLSSQKLVAGSRGRCRIQRLVRDRQAVVVLHRFHFRDAQQAAQLVRRHLHRSRSIRFPGRRLWKCRRARSVKRHVAFHLLHRLVNVPVQHRHRTKVFQQRQRLRAIFRAPAPLRIHRPQRNMRKHHDRRAGLQTLYVLFHPGDLLRAQRAKPASLQVHHVHQAHEVHAFFVEAVPALSLALLRVALQVLFAVVVQHVMLARHVKHILWLGALRIWSTVSNS